MQISATNNQLIAEISINDKAKITVQDFLQTEPFDEKKGNQQKKNANNPQKLTLIIDLNQYSLITHIILTTTMSDFARSNFKFLGIEGNSMSDANYFQQMLQVQEEIYSDNSIQSKNNMSNTMLDIAQKYKQSEKNPIAEDSMEYIKNLFGDLEQQTLLAQQQPQYLDTEDVQNLFKLCYENVLCYGYYLNSSAPASQVVPLLNTSHILKKHNKLDEAAETEIILGLCMINARRYQQSAEIFKKVSLYFAKKSENSHSTELNSIIFGRCPSQKQLQSQQQQVNKSGTKNSQQQQLQSPRDMYSPQQDNQFINYPYIATNNKYLLRAAKIELLVADAINHPSMISEKVEAYQRATEYFTGQNLSLDNQISNNYDVYTALLRLSPHLCKFLLKGMQEKIEPIRIAALKGFEYMVEQLGCSLGSILPTLLHCIITTYPQFPEILPEGGNGNFSLHDQNQRNSIQNQQDISHQQHHQQMQDGGNGNYSNKGQNSSSENSQILNNQNSLALQNYKILVDMYHHLLESFLNVLASASSQILRLIFNDVITPYLFQCDLNQDLRTYIVRICEKIIAICQGDIEINISFFNNIIQLIETFSSNSSVTSTNNNGNSGLLSNSRNFNTSTVGASNLTSSYNTLNSQNALCSSSTQGSNTNFVSNSNGNIANINANSNGQGNAMQVQVNQAQQKIVYTNFKFHILKLWETLKQKFVFNIDAIQLNKVLEWLAESLIQLTENDLSSAIVFNYLFQLLDIIQIICYRIKGSVKQTISSGGGSGNGSGGQNSTCEDLETKKDPKEEQNSQIIQTNNNNQNSQNLNQSIPNIILKYAKKLPNCENIIMLNQQNDQINLKILIKPLILWIDNSLQYQTKLEIFKNIWTVLIDVLNLTTQPAEMQVKDIALPLLQKVSQYCQQSSPTPQMLSFLISLLSSLHKYNKQDSLQLILFLKDFLLSFSDCIPHSIYDESFQVYDLLINLARTVLDEPLINKCLMSLIDQFTVKGKAQKKSKINFIRIIKGNYSSQQQRSENQISQQKMSYFEIALKICLFNNDEPQLQDFAKKKHNIRRKQQNNNSATGGCNNQMNNCINQIDSKSFNKSHEIFSEKLNLAIEMLYKLNEEHFFYIFEKIKDESLQKVLLKLVNSGNSIIRLKGLSLLKHIFEAFMLLYEQHNQNAMNFLNEEVLEDNEFKVIKTQQSQQHDKYQDQPIYTTAATTNTQKTEANQEVSHHMDYKRLLMIKLMMQVLRNSLENQKDCKLQFNALLLLDSVFQNLFCGPTLKSELEMKQICNLEKKPMKNEKLVQIGGFDIDTLDITYDIKLSFSDDSYLNLRLQEILKLWPYINILINSPWSNIRSLTYGIICNWVKPDIKKFSNLLSKLLVGLLTSKESECRTGGLNILGSLCGFGYNYDEIAEKLKNYLDFFRRCEKQVSNQAWEAVFDIQSDWDTTNQAAAVALIQLCANKSFIKQLIKIKNSGLSLKNGQLPYNISSAQQNKNNNFSKTLNSSSRSTTPNNQKTNNTIPNNVSNCSNQLISNNNNTANQNKQDDSLLQITNFLKNINLKQENENSGNRQQIEQNEFEEQKNSILQGLSQQQLQAQQHNQQQQHIQQHIQHRHQSSKSGSINIEEIEDEQIFWVERLDPLDIRDFISMFRNEYRPPQTLWIERINYNMEQQSDRMEEQQDYNNFWFIEDGGLNKEIEYSGEQHQQKKIPQDDDQIDLEDLGIIDVDDEEWNEYDDENKINKKIPILKGKIKNISPELSNRDKLSSPKGVGGGVPPQQQQQQYYEVIRQFNNNAVSGNGGIGNNVNNNPLEYEELFEDEKTNQTQQPKKYQQKQQVQQQHQHINMKMPHKLDLEQDEDINLDQQYQQQQQQIQFEQYIGNKRTLQRQQYQNYDKTDQPTNIQIIDELDLIKLMNDPSQKIFKMDDRTGLRPHNPLFRPLTPPIRTSKDNELQQQYEMYLEEQQQQLQQQQYQQQQLPQMQIAAINQKQKRKISNQDKNQVLQIDQQLAYSGNARNSKPEQKQGQIKRDNDNNNNLPNFSNIDNLNNEQLPLINNWQVGSGRPGSSYKSKKQAYPNGGGVNEVLSQNKTANNYNNNQVIKINNLLQQEQHQQQQSQSQQQVHHNEIGHQAQQHNNQNNKIIQQQDDILIEDITEQLYDNNNAQQKIQQGNKDLQTVLAKNRKDQSQSQQQQSQEFYVQEQEEENKNQSNYNDHDQYQLQQLQFKKQQQQEDGYKNDGNSNNDEGEEEQEVEDKENQVEEENEEEGEQVNEEEYEYNEQVDENEEEQEEQEQDAEIDQQQQARKQIIQQYQEQGNSKHPTKVNQSQQQQQQQYISVQADKKLKNQGFKNQITKKIQTKYQEQNEEGEESDDSLNKLKQRYPPNKAMQQKLQAQQNFLKLGQEEQKILMQQIGKSNNSVRKTSYTSPSNIATKETNLHQLASASSTSNLNQQSNNQHQQVNKKQMIDSKQGHQQQDLSPTQLKKKKKNINKQYESSDPTTINTSEANNDQVVRSSLNINQAQKINNYMGHPLQKQQSPISRSINNIDINNRRSPPLQRFISDSGPINQLVSVPKGYNNIQVVNNPSIQQQHQMTANSKNQQSSNLQQSPSKSFNRNTITANNISATTSSITNNIGNIANTLKQSNSQVTFSNIQNQDRLLKKLMMKNTTLKVGDIKSLNKINQQGISEKINRITNVLIKQNLPELIKKQRIGTEAGQQDDPQNYDGQLNGKQSSQKNRKENRSLSLKRSSSTNQMNPMQCSGGLTSRSLKKPAINSQSTNNLLTYKSKDKKKMKKKKKNHLNDKQQQGQGHHQHQKNKKVIQPQDYEKIQMNDPENEIETRAITQPGSNQFELVSQNKNKLVQIDNSHSAQIQRIDQKERVQTQQYNNVYTREVIKNEEDLNNTL